MNVTDIQTTAKNTIIDNIQLDDLMLFYTLF